eukprot:4447597-Prymnesium_polylepis.1
MTREKGWHHPTVSWLSKPARKQRWARKPSGELAVAPRFGSHGRTHVPPDKRARTTLTCERSTLPQGGILVFSSGQSKDLSEWVRVVQQF